MPTGWASVRQSFDGRYTYTVPYSLHSSFSQLARALDLFRPRECQATSNTAPAAMAKLHALARPYIDPSPPWVGVDKRRSTSDAIVATRPVGFRLPSASELAAALPAAIAECKERMAVRSVTFEGKLAKGKDEADADGDDEKDAEGDDGES